jgi:hypothetical protein
MASLYKRATPSQARIIRAIEGAIKNAGDAHPETDQSAHGTLDCQTRGRDDPLPNE